MKCSVCGAEIDFFNFTAHHNKCKKSKRKLNKLKFDQNKRALNK